MQVQKGWDNSTNLQAEVVNIQNWPQYSEIKEIALDVFNSNFLILKNEAIDLAVERANEFTWKLIDELQKRKLNSIDWVRDPDFQYSLFEAQKSYARTGDKDIESVLIDILTDRLNQPERNLKQIVLDESVSIISKLTSSQLDTLTIIFLLKYSQNNSILNDIALWEYISGHLGPFINDLSKENSLYQHLEFARCWSISAFENKLEDIFQQKYRWLFFHWFSSSFLKEEVDDMNQDVSDLIINSLNDDNLMQPNGLHKDIWLKSVEEKWFDSILSDKLKNLFDQYIFSNSEIKEKLLRIGWKNMQTLLNVWEESVLGKMTLTSVWIAIAQANFRRKTGLTLDLWIWIK